MNDATTVPDCQHLDCTECLLFDVTQQCSSAAYTASVKSKRQCYSRIPVLIAVFRFPVLLVACYLFLVIWTIQPFHAFGNPTIYFTALKTYADQTILMIRKSYKACESHFEIGIFLVFALLKNHIFVMAFLFQVSQKYDIIK